MKLRSLISNLSLYLLIAVALPFPFKANALELIGKAKAYELDIKSTLTNPLLDTPQKIRKLCNDLGKARSDVIDMEYVSLFKIAEPTLLTEIDDADVATTQIGFLISNTKILGVWPFSISEDALLSRIVMLSKKGLPKTSKLAVNFLIANTAISSGNYDQADIAIHDLYGLIESPELMTEWQNNEEALADLKKLKNNDLDILILYLVRSLDLSNQLARGNLDQASMLHIKLNQDFYRLVDFLSLHQDIFGADIYGRLWHQFIMDGYLGRNKELIAKVSYLLKKMPEDSTNIEVLKARSGLLKQLAQSYEKNNDYEGSKRAWNESINLDIKSGFVDSYVFTVRFYYLISNGNYQDSMSLLDSMETYYSSTTPDDYKATQPLINEMKRYANHAKKIGKINDQDTQQHFQFIANYWESTYFSFIETGINAPQTELFLTQALHGFYAKVDNYLAASYYAKLYINQLQVLRSNLAASNNPDLQSFTVTHANTLKSFANTFYEIGDSESAWMCIQIIKENQFLDFIRRSNQVNTQLTHIPFSPAEKEINLRISSLQAELHALNRRLETGRISGDFSDEEKQLIVKSAAIKQTALKIAHKDLSIYFNLPKSFTARPSETSKSISLNSDEAAIWIDFTENFVTSWLFTKGKPVKKFSVAIDSSQFRTLIQDVQIALSTQKEIPNDNLNILSELTILKSLDEIDKLGIKKIKVVTGNMLSLMPINLLRYQGKELGELYSIEKISLTRQPSQTSVKSSRLNAFGASRGGSGFSSLPGVRIEIDTLMAMPSDKLIKSKKAYVDENFTRSSFIKSFDEFPAVVHISSHYTAKGNVARLNKLLLGDGNLISLEDIANELPKLNSLLVTLSACNTGALMPDSAGIAFEGLSTVFHQKGAKYVLSTSWEVADQATADFLGLFYLILLSNDFDPSNALRQTQIAFKYGKLDFLNVSSDLKSNRDLKRIAKNLSNYTHPYYWSGFQISSVQ